MLILSPRFLTFKIVAFAFNQFLGRYLHIADEPATGCCTLGKTTLTAKLTNITEQRL